MTTTAEMPTSPLAAEHITVEFGGVKILDNVSFNAGPGCIMGVVGPNGAGKSTLFNVITALLPATSGQVLIHGRPMAESRGVVAYVPQYERVNSRIPTSVWDVVMQGRVRHVGWFRRPGRNDRAIAEDALNRVGMWDRRKSLIYELSGGQRQRVFVARALAQGADILLLDEAFSGVDIASPDRPDGRAAGAAGRRTHHNDVVPRHQPHGSLLRRVPLPQLQRVRLRPAPRSTERRGDGPALRAFRCRSLPRTRFGGR